MSQSDRIRWNDRYRLGAYQERTHASVVIQDWVKKTANINNALDVACGSGRNALFLSKLGFKVSAIDISGVALDHARQNAKKQGLAVDWYEHDLEFGLPSEVTNVFYDLIILIRYVDLDLIETLSTRLRNGGLLLIEEHLRWDYADDVIGPENSNYRVAPGVLRKSVQNLEVIKYFEGLTTEPDGSTAAVARLLSRKT